MAVHLLQIRDEFLILDGGGHSAFDFRDTHDAHSHFHTGLPEEWYLFELHTEEQRNLSKAAYNLIINRREIIGVFHRIGIGHHAEGTHKLSVRRITQSHDGIIGGELQTGSEEELLVAQLVSYTESASHEALVFILES